MPTLFLPIPFSKSRNRYMAPQPSSLPTIRPVTFKIISSILDVYKKVKNLQARGRFRISAAKFCTFLGVILLGALSSLINIDYNAQVLLELIPKGVITVLVFEIIWLRNLFLILFTMGSIVLIA